MNNQDNNFEENVIKILKTYLKSSAFTQRKITDTPTDNLMVVNKKYLISYTSNNGTTANRPTNPVVGQYYFDLSLSRPIWWNGLVWQDAVGNVV